MTAHPSPFARMDIGARRTDSPFRIFADFDPIANHRDPMFDNALVLLASGAVEVIMCQSAACGLEAVSFSAKWRSAAPMCRLGVRYEGVSSTGQCNTSRSLSAGVSNPKVFRGR
jgi:hypothetical protein